MAHLDHHIASSVVLQFSSPSLSPSGACHSPLPTHLTSAFFGPSSMLPQLAGISLESVGPCPSPSMQESTPTPLGALSRTPSLAVSQQWLLFRCLLGSVSTFATSVSPMSGSSCHLSIPRGGPVSALWLPFVISLSSLFPPAWLVTPSLDYPFLTVPTVTAI